MNSDSETVRNRNRPTANDKMLQGPVWVVLAFASAQTSEMTCASPEEYFAWSRDAHTLSAVRHNISSGAVAIVRDALPRETALQLSASLLRDHSEWREVKKNDGAVSFRFARRALDDNSGSGGASSPLAKLHFALRARTTREVLFSSSPATWRSA